MSAPSLHHDHQSAAELQPESALRCDLSTLSWHAVLLVLWGAFAAGWLPLSIFLLLGLGAFVRNFNALHNLTHAPGSSRSPLAPLRLLVSIITSPLQLSFNETAYNHYAHHRFPRDQERDPNAYLNNRTLWRGLLNAATQPEQSLVRWIRAHGFSWQIARVLLWNVAVLAGLLVLGGPHAFVAWLLLTRLGIIFIWFGFDWVLHHDRYWGRPLPLPLPARLLWRALFGRDNLHGVRYHTLHHAYPSVRNRDLPQLEQRLSARHGPQTAQP